MEFAKLKYFVCVASSETMQQAAEVLNVSQSTLSMAIHGLEEELGVQLFQKVGRKLQLTEAGAALQIEASDILLQLENMRHRIGLYRQNTEGRVAIATEAPDFCAEAETLYRKRRPSCNIIQDLAPRQAIRPLLYSGQVDFALTLFDDSDSAVESTLVLKEPMLLLVNGEHWLANEDRINFNQLGQETLISLPGSYGFRYLCEYFFSMVGIRLRNIHEVRDPEMTPRAVHSGFGVGFIPRSVYLQSQQQMSYVHVIKINDSFCTRQVYLTRLRDKEFSASAQRFFDFLMAYGQWTDTHGRYPQPAELGEIQPDEQEAGA